MRLDISFNQTSLKTIHFEPPVGVVLAQHACHKLFSKEKIVEKINRDIPPLLGCQKTPEHSIGVRLGIFVGSFQRTQRSLNYQALFSEGRKPLTLLDEPLSFL